MENTRLMSRLFSAVNDGDEELLNQVANDIETAKKDGSVETDELTYVDLGENKVMITDNENQESTIAERAEDGNYDLYPAGVENPTEQPEGFLHPEGDGVTPGDQEGAPDENVEDHNPDETPAATVEENAEGCAEDETCPECGKNPCECESEDDDEEREFSVSTDNTVVQRIFSDQEFCERLFSEVIESEETAKVGDLLVEKVADEENAVVVTDENSGDQAKITLDEDTMDVQEMDTKNFSEEGEETANEEEFMPLHIVGVLPLEHSLVDSTAYSEEEANELVARLQEVGVDGVQVFEDEEAARDYAISLLQGLGAESYEEPEQVEFSEHDVFVTTYNSDNTYFMDKLFSESCNEIDATQAAIENVISKGEETETDTEILTPIDNETVIVEDKENGQLTKVVVEDDTLDCTPISEEEADELTDEKTYSNDAETKFFSDNEEMTDYMCRLFSEEADEKEIEKAIESDEQVETDTEIITPVNDNMAVIEDKENNEYTKATLTEEEIEVVPISEDEAAELTGEKTYSNAAETKFFSANEEMTDYMCRLFSEEADEKEVEKAIEDGETVETEKETITPVDAETAIVEDKENNEYTKATMNEEEIEVVPISEEDAKELMNKEEKKEDDEKNFSDNVMDKFFATVAGGESAPEIVEAVYDENGNLVPLNQEAEGVPSVEAIEDAALAAVQAINNAATESVNAVMEAKNTPSENEQAELQEAQFSEKSFSETNNNDTLISWLNNK
jgi:hypothetical protein